MKGTARANPNNANDDSWQDKYFEGSFPASRDRFFFPVMKPKKDTVRDHGWSVAGASIAMAIALMKTALI